MVATNCNFHSADAKSENKVSLFWYQVPRVPLHHANANPLQLIIITILKPFNQQQVTDWGITCSSDSEPELQVTQYSKTVELPNVHQQIRCQLQYTHCQQGIV
jgi:hypothetical protein